MIGAETLLIRVLDADSLHYTYRAGSGKNTDEIIGESLPLELGICGCVWRNKRPWWRGVLDELDVVERNRWELDAGTLILVPMEDKTKFLGGLAGINKISGGISPSRILICCHCSLARLASPLKMPSLMKNWIWPSKTLSCIRLNCAS